MAAADSIYPPPGEGSRRAAAAGSSSKIMNAGFQHGSFHPGIPHHGLFRKPLPESLPQNLQPAPSAGRADFSYISVGLKCESYADVGMQAGASPVQNFFAIFNRLSRSA